MVDAKFKEIVAQGNLSAVRDMLSNRLLVDHDVTGGLFSECWAECERAGIAKKLYQAHDERTLSEEGSESNFNTLVGQLATNFSRERLQCALRVAKAVWPGEQTEPASTARTAQPEQDADDHGTNGEDDCVVSRRILSVRELDPVEGRRIVSERELDSHDEDTSGNRGDNRNKMGCAIPVVVAVVVIAGVLVITRGGIK